VDAVPAGARAEGEPGRLGPEGELAPSIDPAV
jgi:hypothetical protein